ncbi:MAG TPA: alpha-L-rhamnosidase C-terminal domain-containing protein [Vicinamibacteria bacterium]|nr:alpha-L-rhamnosidase C-terminal domain-containing protein [Vicinamibacteria bacterium]
MTKEDDGGVKGDGAVRRREVLKASAAVLGGALAPPALLRGGVAAPVPAPRPASAPSLPPLFEKTAWDRRGLWDASWVGGADAGAPPLVTAYRLRFDWPSAGSVRLRVSADERYELFLDGRRIGRGPERGTIEHWFYDCHDLALSPGPHVLVARVFSLGPYAPLAQFQVRPAFLLAAEGSEAKRLDTGVAAWEARRLPGYSFEPPVYVWGLAAPVTVEGSAFAWSFERGEGEGWHPVVSHEQAASALVAYGIAPSRYLQAGTLPPMLERPWTRASVRHVAEVPSLDTLKIPVRARDHLPSEAAEWQDLLRGGAALRLPTQTRRRVIVDLEDYVCAYPELVTSGGKGSVVRLQFAEGLRVEPDKWKFAKGNRDEVEGKYFLGMGDTFRPDGGQNRRFESLWFASGRYLEIAILTADEPLTIVGLALSETRYPLEFESRFRASEPELEAFEPMLVRGMQACAHETFFDCPYFEQMQYVGDLRLEALTQYVMTRDDRLTRKALYLVDASRHPSGLTESRSPVRQPQFIPWFSLVWIGAVHDHARWRDDTVFVRGLLPGVRAVLECFLARREGEGIVPTPEGWNDTERTRELERSGLTNWLLGWTLRLAAELEDGFGEPELAARCRRIAAELAAASDRAFWNEPRGLYSDSPGGSVFSELVQSLALLSGGCPEARRERVARGLFQGLGLQRSDVHTLHYLFESARLMQRANLVLDGLHLWSEMRRNGLKTPIESAEPTRSDCHAWGSHPLHHFFATLLGIRPAAWGFRRVEIAPMLGRLESASGRLVHPAGGEIAVDLEQKGAALHGRIVLPSGLTGTLQLPAGPRPLPDGETRF